MTCCGCHFSHLPVSSFLQCDAQPCRRYVLPPANWYTARQHRGVLSQEFHIGRFCLLSFDSDTLSEEFQRFGIGQAFDLDKIRPGMLMLRIGQSVLDPIVVSEKEQSFTVRVKPAGRVHGLWKRSVVGKRLPRPLAGELRKNAVWLVEEYDP